MIENWTSPSYIRSFPTIGSIVSGAKIVIDETITMSNVVLLSMKDNSPSKYEKQWYYYCDV